MDYVSHGFWSYIVFHRTRQPLLAVCFGLLPDTASWFIYAVYRLATGVGLGRPILSEIPVWVLILYDISHSIFVAFGVIVIAAIALRRLPLYMLAWPMAIAMDVFTHTRGFLPTPFLWPVSDWAFPGISWATRWMFITNWALIAVAMTLIMLWHRRRCNP